MTDETALPIAEAPEAPAGASEQQTNAAPADENQEAQQPEGEKAEKPERHPLEKELAKERRRISKLVEQREISRAEAANLRAELEKLRPNAQNTDTGEKSSVDDDDVVRIPRAELPKLAERLKGEAAQREEVERGISAMRKGLGDDFQEVTDTLANELGFSHDLQFAVAASEAPAELARYLADPDNGDEAERIARMSPLQAGRAIAKIEAKLAAKPEKPQPSKAPRPLEPVRGGAVVDPDPAKMTDAQWLEHRRKTAR